MTLMRMHGGTAEAEFHSRDITLNQGGMLFLMCDCLHASRKPVNDVSTASHQWHWVFGSSQSRVLLAILVGGIAWYAITAVIYYLGVAGSFMTTNVIYYGTVVVAYGYWYLVPLAAVLSIATVVCRD